MFKKNRIESLLKWFLIKTYFSFGTLLFSLIIKLLVKIRPNNQKLLTAEEVEEVKTTGQVTIGSRTIVFGLPDEEDELESDLNKIKKIILKKELKTMKKLKIKPYSILRVSKN